MLNGGGIRAGKIYEPGARITQGDILAELPFNNRIVVVEITGAELRRAMENGLSALPRPSGRFPQVSGITVQFDLVARAGQPRHRDAGGRRAARSRTRPIASRSLDFLARGGDDYTMFRDAKRVTPDNDAPLMVNEVVEYLRRLGTVRTGVEEQDCGEVVSRYPTGRSSAITLPSFGSEPGATSFTAPFSFVTACKRLGDRLLEAVARRRAFGVQRHRVLLALARHGEAHAQQLGMALGDFGDLLGPHEHALHLGGLVGAAHPALDARVGAPAGRGARQHGRQVAGREPDHRIVGIERW